jgi:formylglycine-generating enzyme required for sulfatase activity
MQDDRDYYTLLGVPVNAPDAEIRKAFRARAKELHPDSKPPGEREYANREFNLLTEAYDTLKDPERRAAYDDELRSYRQVVLAESSGASSSALVMGAAVAFVLAGAAIGATILYDRSARAPKNQESLRIVKVQPQPVAPGAAAGERVQPAPAPVSNPQPVPASEPVETHAAIEPRAVPDQTMAREPAPAAVPAPPPPAAENPAPERTYQSSPSRSQFAGEVLLLESQTSSDPGGVAVYRLVSLVNSATDLGELSEAATLVSKPETIELIHGRIASLRDEQSKALASKSQDAAAQQSASAAAAPAKQDGTFDVPTGARTSETILRLHPGSGLKESFSDCTACPEMVTVPGGQTVIGSRPETRGYRAEEGPAHKIALQKPFAVSKHGISAENWRACVDAGICRPTLASYLTAGPGIPATRVSWFDAKTYVEWLSKTTSRRYRLLSEAEWEYTAQASKAAEAAQKADTPGGRSGLPGLLHLGAGNALKQLTEVKPNGWGVYPLPPNLLEWVEDCWHANYAQAPQDGSPWLSGNGGDCAYRVVRGIAASNGGDFGGRRLAGRARESADARSPTLGFRVARDLAVLAKTAADATGGKHGE